MKIDMSGCYEEWAVVFLKEVLSHMDIPDHDRHINTPHLLICRRGVSLCQYHRSLVLRYSRLCKHIGRNAGVVSIMGAT